MAYDPTNEVSYPPKLAELLIKNYNPDCSFEPRTAFVFKSQEEKESFLDSVANSQFSKDIKNLQGLMPPLPGKSS